MNTTERKLVSQDNITDTNISLKTYLGNNSIFLEFRSSLKSKLLKFIK
jgi:hypothetical protein